ncbi:MAG: hypothetical protein K2Q14_07460 [Gammaproteobacteria bacterium]|nr:hypothetical protein [Gammaproteobacteria bacterium]
MEKTALLQSCRNQLSKDFSSLKIEEESLKNSFDLTKAITSSFSDFNFISHTAPAKRVA